MSKKALQIVCYIVKLIENSFNEIHYSQDYLKVVNSLLLHYSWVLFSFRYLFLPIISIEHLVSFLIFSVHYECAPMLFNPKWVTNTMIYGTFSLLKCC